MKILMIFAALGLLAVAGFVVADSFGGEETEEVLPTCGSSSCDGGCTAESNCGVASCGAVSGGSCGCGR